MQDAIVLDRESGEMGVGDQIPRRIARAQHLLKKSPMLISGLKQPHAALIEPALHASDPLFRGEGTPMQPGVRADADIGGEHGPAQPDGVRAAQLWVPPGARCFMMLRETVLGVEQKVRQKSAIPSSHGT